MTGLTGEYFVCEREAERISFAHHDYVELLNETNGCTAGCRTGLLYYRQTAYHQGGVHDDQEGFFVLEGSGTARVGDREFPISPGTSFIAPAGAYHYIKRDEGCLFVKLFFFHAAARKE